MAALFADHALEFPGGYTRSTGPVIGRFLTELRDGRLVGIAAPGGRVLVPPLEYDPATGAALGGNSGADPFIPVGPAGTVTAWAWVTEPRKVHPLRQPFGWALIRIDGADTALLHAVDTGGKQKAMRTGLRVRPRWRDVSERVGSIRDIECFVPEVTMLNAPARLEYRLPAGRALGRFLDGIAEGRFLGHRCGVCGKVYVPLRGLCPADGVPTAEEVEVSGTGTITTFAVNNIPDPRAPDVPFVCRAHPARRGGHPDPRADRRHTSGPGPDGHAGAGGMAAARRVGTIDGQHQVVRADGWARGASPAPGAPAAPPPRPELPPRPSRRGGRSPGESGG